MSSQVQAQRIPSQRLPQPQLEAGTSRDFRVYVQQRYASGCGCKTQRQLGENSPPEDKHLVLLAGRILHCNLQAPALKSRWGRLVVRKSDTHVMQNYLKTLSFATSEETNA